MKALILYNQLTEIPGPDEADVLDQVKLIHEKLNELNVETEEMQFSLRIDLVEDALIKAKPDFVFNLVESVNNRGSLVYLAPGLLASLGIPFSGGGVETIFFGASKVISKERMVANGIPTSPWFRPDKPPKIDPNKRYIVKPIWEEGSLGLDEDCVFWGNEPKFFVRLSEVNYKTHFVEEYIHGREFNLSVLAGPNGPQVLHPAEMIFHNYPEDKPKVMGYTAKWKEEAFEYTNTIRTFKYNVEDNQLLSNLISITEKCWHVFEMNGYARVDFRVDTNGQPFVLEVNINPCLTPGSGFYAACEQVGIPFKEAVRRIVNDIPNLEQKI